MKPKRGGARPNSGAKKKLDKVKAIAVYLRQTQIDKLGGLVETRNYFKNHIKTHLNHETNL